MNFYVNAGGDGGLIITVYLQLYLKINELRVNLIIVHFD